MSKKLKRGFTLVELIVVMMLMGIITTAVVMVLRPASRLSVDVNNKSDEETGAITLFDYVNGKLRYATDVMVVSNDDPSTMPSHGNMKNYILLCNDVRAESKKGARGYAKHGLTSQSPSQGVPCVSESILAENDFQFSIDGSIVEPGAESLTVGAIAHPMMATYSNFVIDESKPYRYSETFQLLNMQNRSQLKTTTVGNLSITGYDSSKKCIWIFYEEPTEAKLNGITGGGTPGSAGIGTPTKNSKGTKTVNLGESMPSLIIHFQKGNDSSKNNYKYARTGNASVYEENGNKASNQDQTWAEQTQIIYFEPGSSIKVMDQNGHDTFGEWDYDWAKNNPNSEVWIYDYEVHNAPYTPPAALGGSFTVHYIQGTSDKTTGIMFKNGSSLKDSLAVDSQKLNESWETAEYTNNSDYDVHVDFYLTGASVNIYNRDAGSNPVLIATIESDTFVDGSEYWVYNGIWSDTPPAIFRKTLTVHYLESMQGFTEGLRLKDKDGIDGTPTIVNGSFDYEGKYDFKNPNSDVVIKFSSSGSSIELYNLSAGNTETLRYIFIVADDTPDESELWFYNGEILDQPPVEPDPINVIVHTKQGVQPEHDWDDFFKETQLLYEFYDWGGANDNGSKDIINPGDTMTVELSRSLNGTNKMMIKTKNRYNNDRATCTINGLDYYGSDVSEVHVWIVEGQITVGDAPDGWDS